MQQDIIEQATGRIEARGDNFFDRFMCLVYLGLYVSTHGFVLLVDFVKFVYGQAYALGHALKQNSAAEQECDKYADSKTE